MSKYCYVIPQTKINSQRLIDLHVRAETIINLIQETMFYKCRVGKDFFIRQKEMNHEKN